VHGNGGAGPAALPSAEGTTHDNGFDGAMTSQRKVTNGMQPLSCASLRTHDNEPTIAVCRVTKRTAMGQPLL
jgi:hypothetical protein